jgi:PKD repeat protein
MMSSGTFRRNDAGAILRKTVCLFLLGIFQAAVVLGQVNANFGAKPTEGCAPLTVVFSDASSGTPVSWAWSFPGGSPSSATGAGPHTVTYYTPGTFDVSLTVTWRDSTTDTETKADYIIVNDCKNAYISNWVWLDANGNGIQETGESGMANVQVELYRSDGTFLAPDVTDAAGDYMFPSLAAGDYFVKFTPPPGYGLTLAHQGASDALDSDANPVTFSTGTFGLAAAYHDQNTDAGLVRSSQEFETDHWDTVCYILDLDVPGLGHSLVTLTGPVTQEVYIGPTGSASDSDSDGLDQVQTELQALDLTGTDPLFGNVRLRLNSSKGSFGEIEEMANMTPGILDIPAFRPVGTAISYVNAFFEIELADLGICLRNEPSIRLQAMITHKPPFSFNVHVAVLGSPAPLYSVTCGTGAWTLPVPPPNPAAHFLALSPCGSLPQTEVDIFKVCFQVGLELERLGTLNLQMVGLMTQRVYFDGPTPGDATDGDSDGLDEVYAELIDLNLHGVDPAYGNVTIRLHPGVVCKGQIEEMVNATPGRLDLPPFTPTGQAFCAFDVYFEIELVDAGICLRTYVPTKLSGTVDHKPPEDLDVFSAIMPPSTPLHTVTCGAGPLPAPTTPATDFLTQMGTCGSGEPDRFEFGDAPAPYPTLLADNGARHGLANPQIYMGPSPAVLDVETDGQPGPNAAGDDVSALDDEDGVILLASSDLSPGGHIDITVIANTGPRIDACINLWVDWNQNGSWGDPGERVLHNTHGDVLWPSWIVPIPPDAVPGETYARFRICLRPLGDSDFTGEVEDGEVEDYKLKIGDIKPDSDLGDAPDGTNSSGSAMTAYPAGGPPGVDARFPTVFAAGSPPFGPKHRFPREVAWLGPLVTLEREADAGLDEDGVNNILPPGDLPDRDGADDCIKVPLELPSCVSTSFNYTATTVRDKVTMYVNVWFDWNRDGDWNDNLLCLTGLAAPEWAVQNQAISLASAGSYTLATPLFTPYEPDSKTPRPIWMRITLSEQRWSREWMDKGDGGGCGPSRGYEFGETEDYYFVPIHKGDRDFGDAKEAFPTKLASNGARHEIQPGLFLGTVIDAESDGQPSTDADEDDVMIVDDEDGVTFTSDLTPGGTASVDVFATGRGYLNAWIDFNRDDDWADVNEHVITDVLIPPGLNPLTFPVPADATPGKTYARFRFCQETGLGFDGAAKNGEVEDYLVQIPSSGKNPIKWIQPPLKVRPSAWPDSVWHCWDGWAVPSIDGYLQVADDWICRDPKPVTSVTWWGSYANWDTTVAPPNAPWGFRIALYKDLPKSWDTTYSRPGEKVWEWKVSRGAAGEAVDGSHFRAWSGPDTVFKYTLHIAPADWFYQEGDSTLYWVSITALYPELPDMNQWGWLMRSRYFHDDAAYHKTGEPWAPITSVIPSDADYFSMSDMTFVLGTTDTRREFDFGDAPDPLFPTLLATGGAEHWFDTRFRLGTDLDTEADGQPTADASGDGSDEDGVSWPSSLLAGTANTLKVTASTAGVLNAWMDFDGNMEWNSSEEHFCTNLPLSAGINYVTFLAPTDVKSEPIGARFRFSAEADLTPLGLAIDGEVEDFVVKFETTGVEEATTLPGQNRLMQNYPNPFNPSTKIEFELKAAGPVKLLIYDLTGRRVAVLIDGRREAGRHTVTWEGRDSADRSVSGGLYLLRIEAGNFKQTKKLLLMK